MEKLTDNRSGNLGEEIGDLWMAMERARDNDEFTLLCERATELGMVRGM